MEKMQEENNVETKFRKQAFMGELDEMLDCKTPKSSVRVDFEMQFDNRMRGVRSISFPPIDGGPLMGDP